MRNLEKQIRKIIRKAALKQAESDTGHLKVRAKDIRDYLGKPPFHTEKLYNRDVPGVALGLAYTSMGGTTLYVEATGITSKNGQFK